MLIGRLGQDPELRYTQTQKPVVNFSLATTMKDASGKETTEWHKIVVWDKQAENCKQFLSKGKMCYVEGRIATRTWEKDGTKHYATDIIASQVQFLSPREEGSQTQRPAHAPSSGGPSFDFQSLNAPGSDPFDGIPF